MDVSALGARVPLSDSTVYFLNDRAVSKQEATAVAAGDISSVEVKRLNRSKPVAEVHVTLVSDSTRRVLKLGSDSAQRAYQSDKGSKGFLERTNNGADDPTQTLTLQSDSNRLSILPRRDPDASCNTNTVTAVGADGGARVRIRGQAVSGVAQPCTEHGAPLIIVDGVVMAPGAVDLKRRDPLIIVDGVIMAPGAFDLSTINRNDIESIEVIKGAAAANRYGPAAADGVISIKRKK